MRCRRRSLGRTVGQLSSSSVGFLGPASGATPVGVTLVCRDFSSRKLSPGNRGSPCDFRTCRGCLASSRCARYIPTRLYACPQKEREKEEPIPPEKSKPKQQQYRNDTCPFSLHPPCRCVMVTSTGALVGMASLCFAFSCEAFIASAPTILSARPTSTAVARMSAGSDYVSTLPGGTRHKRQKNHQHQCHEG